MQGNGLESHIWIWDYSGGFIRPWDLQLQHLALVVGFSHGSYQETIIIQNMRAYMKEC